MTKATNWTAYYDRPFFLAPYTRALGARGIINALKRAGVRRAETVAEFGGGNSSVYDSINQAFAPVTYTCIDRNELGLRLIADRAGANIVVVTADILASDFKPITADVVLSIGLVEHFDEAGTRKAIERHFECTRPGGVVLITFPTPTLLYRCSRAISEALGLWKFPDERPLTMDETLTTIKRCGEVIESRIAYWTPFTQGIVTARCK